MISAQRLHINTSISRLTFNTSNTSHSSLSCAASPKILNPDAWNRLFNNGRKIPRFHERTTKTSDVSSTHDSSSVSPTLNENSRLNQVPTPIQNHIEHLYKQLADLTTEITHERIQHGLTKRKCRETIGNHDKQEKQQFQVLLSQHIEDHRRELREQEEKHSKIIHEEKENHRLREVQLTDQINFLKQSFHVYKIKLQEDAMKLPPIKLPEKVEEKTDSTEIESGKEIPVDQFQRSTHDLTGSETNSTLKLETPPKKHRARTKYQSTKTKIRVVNTLKRNKSTENEIRPSSHALKTKQSRR